MSQLPTPNFGVNVTNYSTYTLNIQTPDNMGNPTNTFLTLSPVINGAPAQTKFLNVPYLNGSVTLNVLTPTPTTNVMIATMTLTNISLPSNVLIVELVEPYFFICPTGILEGISQDNAVVITDGGQGGGGGIPKPIPKPISKPITFLTTLKNKSNKNVVLSKGNNQIININKKNNNNVILYLSNGIYRLDVGEKHKNFANFLMENGCIIILNQVNVKLKVNGSIITIKKIEDNC